jgi:hypothetical protein
MRSFEAVYRGLALKDDIFDLISLLDRMIGKQRNIEVFTQSTLDFLSLTRKLLRRKITANPRESPSMNR